MQEILNKIQKKQPFVISAKVMPAGIIKYLPEELILTVYAGTKISTITQALDKHNQCLPFLSNNTTIGGAYANGTSLNQYYIRDFVLGVKLIDGQAREMSFGGEMLKNVAGFDVARLLIGSKGKFAVITQISFKVLPKNYIVESVSASILEVQKSARLTQIEQDLKKVFDPYNLFL